MNSSCNLRSTNRDELCRKSLGRIWLTFNCARSGPCYFCAYLSAAAAEDLVHRHLHNQHLNPPSSPLQIWVLRYQIPTSSGGQLEFPSPRRLRLYEGQPASKPSDKLSPIKSHTLPNDLHAMENRRTVGKQVLLWLRPSFLRVNLRLKRTALTPLKAI